MANLIQIFIACACVLAVSAIPYGKSRNAYSYPFNFVCRDSWGARPPNVGGEGSVYEGRGWESVGAHAVSYNVKSIGICMIGDFVDPYLLRPEFFARSPTPGRLSRRLGGEEVRSLTWPASFFASLTASQKEETSSQCRSLLQRHSGQKLPPQTQLESLQKLIASGVELGYISRDYKLIGHRQVSATECPGQALFNEISTWDHFTPAL
ncbi:hypothetical protein SFRURICE_009450 [Spodoptera frugiperda]|nr:hypothetical protein SFRURICE_009450 [Spodoptera frugiperda]